MQKNNRRQFFKTATAGGLFSFTTLNSPIFSQEAEKIDLSEGETILFQGDSITDANRNREIRDANNQFALGTGYVFIASAALLHRCAGKKIKIYNRGVSGNSVPQLTERWKEDCLDLKPGIISILIGVNDFWITLKQKEKPAPNQYLANFKDLLDRTKQKLPDAKLIIGEPFAIKGVMFADDNWFPAFADYQAAAFEIARKFQGRYIPYQSIFDKALKSAPGSHWTTDGVHTDMAGNHLMAESWLSNIKLT